MMTLKHIQRVRIMMESTLPPLLISALVLTTYAVYAQDIDPDPSTQLTTESTDPALLTNMSSMLTESGMGPADPDPLGVPIATPMPDDLARGEAPANEPEPTSTPVEPDFETVLTPEIQASALIKPIKNKIKQRKRALKAVADASKRLRLRREVFELKQDLAQLKVEKLSLRQERLDSKRIRIEQRLENPDLTLDTRTQLEDKLVLISEREQVLDTKLLNLDDKITRWAQKIETTQTKLGRLGYVDAEDLPPTEAPQG